MLSSNNIAKLALAGALTMACFQNPASAADRPRSSYQNASANCHAASTAEENKLIRTPQRFRNDSLDTVEIVCSFMTDAFATTGPTSDGSTNDGVVDYVALWAKRYEVRGDNTSLTCLMVTSYADDTRGQTLARSKTLPLAAPNSGQAVLEWIPVAGQKFRAPINVSCAMPPKTELNDWFVSYTSDIGADNPIFVPFSERRR